jgi:hypothetical protein
MLTRHLQEELAHDGISMQHQRLALRHLAALCLYLRKAIVHLLRQNCCEPLFRLPTGCCCCRCCCCCLQECIQDLKVQLAALVDSFEQQCGTFCSAFSRPQLEQQQVDIQQQEQQAEACLRAAQQQLQAKGKQLTEQKAAVKQLQQQVADSRASIKGMSML